MPRPHRLLLVQTQAENAGAQEISRLLCEQLTARGYEVHQLFFFRRTASFDNLPLTSFCTMQRPSNPLALAKFFITLFQEYRRIKPDVTLTFQHFGNLLGGVMARLAGLKNIIANVTSAPLTMNGAVRLADKLVGTIGVYDKIIVNSKDTLVEYSAWPQGYQNHLVRIDHGFEDKSVAISKIEARRELGLPEDAVLLGCVARLHYLKQLEANVKLLGENPHWHLGLVGQGPEQDKLVALARTMGVSDRLHLLGELPPRKIGVFLASLDVFAFPTLAETFGLAAVEAAQAGIPVVANRLPVLEEVLEVGGEPCAVFVEAADTKDFAAGVAKVLGDEALRQKLITGGQQLKQRYSLSRMIDDYQQVIESVGA